MRAGFAYHSAGKPVRPVFGPRGHVIRGRGKEDAHSTHFSDRAICHHASCFHEGFIKQVTMTHANFYTVFVRGSHNLIAVGGGEGHWLFYQNMTSVPHSFDR